MVRSDLAQWAEKQFSVRRCRRTSGLSFSGSVYRCSWSLLMMAYDLRKGPYGMSYPRMFSNHAISSRAVTTIASHPIDLIFSRVASNLESHVLPVARISYAISRETNFRGWVKIIVETHKHHTPRFRLFQANRFCCANSVCRPTSI